MDGADRSRLHADFARLADGDRSAFSPVFRALWPPVRALCARTLGGDSDADDAAQEALRTLFLRAGEYDGQGSVLAWAMAIAAWQCRTLLRRRQRARAVPLSAAERHADAGASPEAAVIAADLQRAALEILGQLSPEDRQILEAACSAEGDGARSALFRKRKQRALERLQRAWRQWHGK